MGEKKGPATLGCAAGWFRSDLALVRPLFPASPSMLPHTCILAGVQYSVAVLEPGAVERARRLDAVGLLGAALFGAGAHVEAPALAMVICDLPQDVRIGLLYSCILTACAFVRLPYVSAPSAALRKLHALLLFMYC